jgi:hypothetical protein
MNAIYTPRRDITHATLAVISPGSVVWRHIGGAREESRMGRLAACGTAVLARSSVVVHRSLDRLVASADALAAMARAWPDLM